MSGVPLTGPLVPEGNFPAVDAAYVGRGWIPVLNNTERDNIPTERRGEGMVTYVVATRLLWQLRDGIGNENWQPFPAEPGLYVQRFHLIQGIQSTDFEFTPQVIGAAFFEPVARVPQSDARARAIFLTTILETTNVDSPAHIALYDFETPEVVMVPGSEIISVSLTPEAIVTNVSGALAGTFSSRVIEAHLWLENTQSGRLATCKAAYFDLVFG